MAKSFTLYKLIILYMLNEVDFPLTNSQISEFILDEGYTTYFKLQQALSELLESGFIREESTHHRTFYHLTEDGAETIHYFTNDISPAIQHDIDEFQHGIFCTLSGHRTGTSSDRPHRNSPDRIRSCNHCKQLAETEPGDLCVSNGEVVVVIILVTYPGPE